MPSPDSMKAMVLENPGGPLHLRQVPIPQPFPEQILLKVHACGVCRTDLHIVDQELTKPKLPLIPGHEIIGMVMKMGEKVEDFHLGERVGVPWLGHTCGKCLYCQRNQENLCDQPLFTGYTIDGGYAEYCVADQHYCFHIPEKYSNAEAAPLLCAGLIGYRTYRMIGEKVKNVGIYGFGAAAHIICQVAVYEGMKVYAFTRPGDTVAQKFARQLGAVWAGDSTTLPPQPLDAAMIFAPVGALIPEALRAVVKGGTVVSGGIHMSDIPSFPYSLLWEERIVRSVANLTRQDGEDLLNLAPKVPIKTIVQIFTLEEANKAMNNLREGRIEGAAILVMTE